MMHFDLKNHGQDFTNMKLSELSERANHVLSALQIALGFVMAFNTAILAVLIAVGQTINQNCNWSCPESFKSLILSRHTVSFFLSSLFLTCAFTSFTYFAVIKDGSIYVCIIIFFIVSFVALIIRYFVLFNQTNSNYKPWIIKRLSQLKDFLLKKFR